MEQLDKTLMGLLAKIKTKEPLITGKVWQKTAGNQLNVETTGIIPVTAYYFNLVAAPQ